MHKRIHILCESLKLDLWDFLSSLLSLVYIFNCVLWRTVVVESTLFLQGKVRSSPLSLLNCGMIFLLSTLDYHL